MPRGNRKTRNPTRQELRYRIKRKVGALGTLNGKIRQEQTNMDGYQTSLQLQLAANINQPILREDTLRLMQSSSTKLTILRQKSNALQGELRTLVDQYSRTP